MPDSPQLILLRHAKSDWDAGARSDFDRPLNARGRRDAPRMGAWLADNGYAPDCVVASPAARAKETAELACAAMGYDAAQINYERALYHAPADAIRAVAAAGLARHRRVLVVAHNPGMEDALADFCPDARAFDDGKLMPTCAAAVMECAGAGDGGDGDETQARLLAHMRPSRL